MQKARTSINLRNHMRLWKTQYEYQGQEVYIGRISREIEVPDWEGVECFPDRKGP